MTVKSRPGRDSVTGFNEYGSETPTFLHGAYGTRLYKEDHGSLAVDGSGSTHPRSVGYQKQPLSDTRREGRLREERLREERSSEEKH
jgi:hypothetical protein